MEATGCLVEANTLQFTNKLEISCQKNPKQSRCSVSDTVLNSLLFIFFYILKCLKLTCGISLKQQRDDAEEVDVGVIDSELHQDGPGLCIQPPAPGQRLQDSEG